MKISSVFKFIWRWVGPVSAAGFLILFYGAVATVCGIYFFGMEEMSAWLFVGLPIGLLVAAIMWKRLPKILGIDD